jgi:Holliday junction DNA helicase RuvA
MIGYLQGKIKSIGSDGTLILVSGGIGWVVNYIRSTNYLEGQEADIIIHTQVKEDSITLFGFPDIKSKDLFLKITDVSGIGAKTAMTLLSQVGYNSIISAITNDDPNSLKVPGVGKKTAEKLVFELKDKLDEFGFEQISEGQGNKMKSASEALLGLGYSKGEVEEAISEIKKIDNLDINSMSEQDIVKHILKFV